MVGGQFQRAGLEVIAIDVAEELDEVDARAEAVGQGCRLAGQPEPRGPHVKPAVALRRALAEREFPDGDTLKAAKRFTRMALKPYLGGKPLKSRELFRLFVPKRPAPDAP